MSFSVSHIYIYIYIHYSPLIMYITVQCPYNISTGPFNYTSVTIMSLIICHDYKMYLATVFAHTTINSYNTILSTVYDVLIIFP